MVNKRERDYQRKRLEKWQARQAAARAKQRRTRIISLSVAGALTLGLVAFLFINRPGPTPTPTPTPAATTLATTPGPTPSPSGNVPDPALAEGRTWTAVLTTNLGEITLELDGAAAPQAVAAFVTLAQQGFYSGNYCHRLTTQGIFVLQCGDPNATPGGQTNGIGGPDFRFGPIENAPADDMYPTGTVAFARQQNDGFSMGSQFFLVWQDSPIPSDAAGGYSVFGTITSGLDIVQQVAAAGTGPDGVAPATEVTIEKIEVS